MNGSVIKSSKVLSDLNGKLVMLYECDFSQNEFFMNMYKSPTIYVKSTDIFKLHPNLYKQIKDYTNNIKDI